MNLGDFIIIAIILAVILLIIFKMSKDKKRGKNSCSGCPNFASCHGNGKSTDIGKKGCKNS